MAIATLGTINGYSAAPCRVGHHSGTFDGTIKGLTLAAIGMGATIGSMVLADFGGGWRRYIITSAPHDQRANGLWAIAEAN